MNKKLVIAVDGYSSCGKSTLATDLAKTINYIYIDSGAMYRAITLFAIKENLISEDKIDEKNLLKKTKGIHIDFRFNSILNREEIFMNGKCIEDEIRKLYVADKVSYIAKIREVRKRMVFLQRQLGENGGIVMDGRDIGTVVFPNADLKIFMTADADVRAERRFKELVIKYPNITIEEVKANITHRDDIDENRKESPLRKAVDAFVIDNTHLTRDQQLQMAINKINEIFAKKKCFKVVIDPNSGYCFGVTNAICRAEEQLEKDGKLYVVGDIVHNNMEVERLKRKGLKSINHKEFSKLSKTKVLIRAHGEPPSTYKTAIKNFIQLLDASCPIVLKLQKQVKRAFEESKKDNAQIVIYGKKGHAEVNGLVGQTNDEAIVIEDLKDIQVLDFSRPVILFSQTTKSVAGFQDLVEKLNQYCKSGLKVHDTICRIVSNRVALLKKFALKHDIILFVSGKKSSNGKFLYSVCKSENPNTFFISTVKEVNFKWLDNINSVGICGATSTPHWLMKEVCKAVENYKNE